MQIKILITIIPSWTFMALGVIDYSVTFKDPETEKVIYFLGDDHSKIDEAENARQLKRCKKQLYSYEDRSEPLEILIENPSTLAKKTRKESGVLLSLYDYVRKKDFTRVSIEDIDVRQTANAACFLLSSHYPGFDYSQSFNDGDKPLHSLRFKDVYLEYKKIDTCIKAWNTTHCKPLLHSNINEFLELGNENHESFKEDLKKFEISENDTILPWAMYQHDETPIQRKTLAGDVYNTFAPLMEAYTLQKIDSSHSPTLLAIAGTYHIKSIQSSIALLPGIIAGDYNFLGIS
jgi:hypothetical protein